MTENNNNNSDESIYDKMREQLKKRKPLLAAAFAGDEDVLRQVREYEQASALVGQQAGLVIAKGEDIERLALLDPVTELYNHRAFVKELKSEFNRSKRYKHPCSICMISIDEFDRIGDEFGALTQDAVLKVVANVIRSSTREVDLSSRYTPKSFCVVLPQTNTAPAALVAERIRTRVANQVFSYNWTNFSVTTSIGVATYPQHGQEYDELLARSIEAMQFSLERGGDRVFSF